MSRDSQDLIATLVEGFPTAFMRVEPKPLKVGIRNDIAKLLDVNPRALRVALGHYCRRAAYLLACKEGTIRVGLDGEPAGIITATEAVHADKVLNERKADWRRKDEATLEHARQVKAKPREKLTPAEVEHDAARRGRSEAARNSSYKRKRSREAMVTRTKPTIVVTVTRPRLSLRSGARRTTPTT
jgi:ProP effector